MNRHFKARCRLVSDVYVFSNGPGSVMYPVSAVAGCGGDGMLESEMAPKRVDAENMG
jgi:hypothetical protein